MIIQTIADVDTQIVGTHWRSLHGGWAGNEDEVALAKAAIDMLLERRYQLMQAADDAA